MCAAPAAPVRVAEEKVKEVEKEPLKIEVDLPAEKEEKLINKKI